MKQQKKDEYNSGNNTISHEQMIHQPTNVTYKSFYSNKFTTFSNSKNYYNLKFRLLVHSRLEQNPTGTLFVRYHHILNSILKERMDRNISIQKT